MQYYLLVRNTVIAVIHNFERKGNICSFELEEQDDPMINLFIDSGILGKHFQAVKETMSLACVSCSDFVGLSESPFFGGIQWDGKQTFLTCSAPYSIDQILGQQCVQGCSSNNFQSETVII